MATRCIRATYQRRYQPRIIETFFAPLQWHAVEKALQLDTQIMLVDDPVKRVDNMTMASASRAVPFASTRLSNSQRVFRRT